MLYRIVSKTSETRISLDQYDLRYMFSLYEAIDLEDYIELLRMKDAEAKALAERQQKSKGNGMGFPLR
jgi:hypothetical protein